MSEQKVWRCQGCGVTQPWWPTAAAFPYCVKCETKAKSGKRHTRWMRRIMRKARID